MRKEKTVKELVEFGNVIVAFLNEEEKLTKLSACCKKQLKIINESLNDYFDKLDNLKRKLCSIDENKNIIMTQDNKYAFTRENSALLKSQTKVLLKEIVSVEIIIENEYLDTLQDGFKYEFYEFLNLDLESEFKDK